MLISGWGIGRVWWRGGFCCDYLRRVGLCDRVYRGVTSWFTDSIYCVTLYLSEGDKLVYMAEISSRAAG